MFRHLRNRLIFINLAVTTVVLVLAFSLIYVVAQEGAERRKSLFSADLIPGYAQVVVEAVTENVRAERSEALSSLLVSLIIVGLSVEVAVAVLSYILAEAAIRPVKEAYETQKVFIANASHEMKTPIAAIMANLEVADIHDNPWIDNVNQEVELLANLNHELLTLARAENAMSAAKANETVVLKQYVEEILAPFQPRIHNQKVQFEFKTQLKSGKAKLSKTEFSQIVSILMDNALKYCDKTIIVTLTSKSFTISNDGAKISKQDLPHIFDRFYQTDKSSDGVGLGLAIAKTLADRQDWKLTATSDAHATTFRLEF